MCMISQGTDLEKRLKKIPETYLSSALVEFSTNVGENTPLGSALRYCGEAMSHIGKDTLQYELDIEMKVFQPLNMLLETYLPVINKFKKQLNRQTLEMDICKTRYNEMLRRSYCSVNEVQSNATKIDSLKDDYIDACNKLDHIKDAYTTEMFKFLSKEGEISNILLNVLEAQIECHKSLSTTLDSILAKARDYISSSYIKPAFGCPLQEYLDLTNSFVSPIIEDCINILLEIGLDEVGLFRMTGSSPKIKKLKSAFDSGSPVDMQEFIQDPHVITGILKLYLRELPEPLLTFKLYDEWSNAGKMEENSFGDKEINERNSENEGKEKTLLRENKLAVFASLLKRLPKANLDNLRYLIQFMSLIVDHSDVNLMTSSNLAIVLGPNLLWKHMDLRMDLSNTNVQNSIAEFLIVNCNALFPEKIDFKNYDNSKPVNLFRNNHLDNNLAHSIPEPGSYNNNNIINLDVNDKEHSITRHTCHSLNQTPQQSDFRNPQNNRAIYSQVDLSKKYKKSLSNGSKPSSTHSTISNDHQFDSTFSSSTRSCKATPKVHNKDSIMYHSSHELLNNTSFACLGIPSSTFHSQSYSTQSPVTHHHYNSNESINLSNSCAGDTLHRTGDNQRKLKSHRDLSISLPPPPPPIPLSSCPLAREENFDNCDTLLPAQQIARCCKIKPSLPPPPKLRQLKETLHYQNA
ncbi:rho GTPase-activating protein 44-like [Gordionus sp. m RMFG-2023]|uniref:rho GTPase-activating protein 44-like n=1 Tax=Gordionus sp. m RMFG-2023 TaxID=3053472 RepID=UPI0031FC9706